MSVAPIFEIKIWNSNRLPPFAPAGLMTSTQTQPLRQCVNVTKSTSSATKEIGMEKKKKTTVAEDTDIEDFDFCKEETDEIRGGLLQWYDHNQREIPWRINPRAKQESISDEERAYAVWVSEMMLQQTRVSVVIEYYNRWMQKWPTIHHLAAATQEEVNQMWAGLGYYRRARFLLEGAKMLVNNHTNTNNGLGCCFPTSASGLLNIPGIGQYTAGAIASIAFNKAVPVVDGNVIRVLARLKAISANPKEATTVKTFWKLAGQLVDPSRPGDFNQALMELGATLCTVASPGCSGCPISGHCQAFSLTKDHKSVTVTDYPMKVPKAKPKLEFCGVCVVEILDSQCPGSELGTEKKSEFLLVKRPEEGLLAGLWEFPSVWMDGEADLAMRREAIDRYLKKVFKLDAKIKHKVLSRSDVGECVHIFTHIRLRMHVELLVLRLKGGAKSLYGKKDDDGLTWKCVDSNSIAKSGLTSGVRKVYNMIVKYKQKQLTSISSSRKRKKT